jgi:hypothetical protein
MQEITKIIISVIAGFFGFSIVYSLFKFIILNYFKKINKNEEKIIDIDKRLSILEGKETKKNP